jgi:transcriptional regulator with XRE-family HTH domain
VVAGGRRRTPGLRREELAILAGISVDYLTRIEQGREPAPSSSVVASLASALRLDASERRHLVALASLNRQQALCPPTPSETTPSPTVEAILDRLQPLPAVVLEAWLDVRAWNAGYWHLMSLIGLFDHTPPNVLRSLFLAPSTRLAFRDWATVSRQLVGVLRSASANCHAVERAGELAAELGEASPDFLQLWVDQPVEDRQHGLHRLTHPVVGDMDLEFEVLALAGDSGQHLLVYRPINRASEDRLHRLERIGRPVEGSTAVTGWSAAGFDPDSAGEGGPRRRPGSAGSRR